MFDRLNTTRIYLSLGLTIMALALGVYLLTLAPTVLLADGGEFQFTSWLPGITHPTGYPLYTLLGWLFSHGLPFGEVAWRLNLYSAVMGTIAIGLVYLISRDVTTRLLTNIPPIAHHLTAAATALTFAFGHTFWSQVIIAEVYGLHALFVALILWMTLRLADPLAAADEPPRPLTFRRAWPLALAVGLSLTHHRTIVVMLPAVLLYLWLIGRRWPAWTDSLKLLGLIVLPGLLYFYLPLIAPHVPYTQLQLSPERTLILYDNSVDGFIAHISGRVFASSVAPGAIDLARLSLTLDFARQQVGWVGLGLALIGLGSLLKRPPLLVLTLGAFLGFYIFNLIYFIGDIFVLFIPCWLILSLWIGAGWLEIVRLISSSIVEQKRVPVADNPAFGQTVRRMEESIRQLLIIGLAALLLGLPLGLLLTRYAEIDQSHNTIARDGWQEILAANLPLDSILVSNDRNEIMPMWYYQYVKRQRPDWLGLFPLITTDPDVANVGRLLDQALAANRPVFLVKPMDGLEVKADLIPLDPLPHAQLVAATQPELNPDHPAQLAYADQLAIIGYDQEQAGTRLTITLYWQPQTNSIPTDYTTFVHLIDPNGNGLAQSDHLPGGVFYPTSLWQPGETLRDRHSLTLPSTLSPGTYTLIAGLYRNIDGQIEPLGQPQPLGQITIP